MIFSIDQEDLYVYEKRGGEYRYGDGWEPVTTIEEAIDVRGADTETVTLKFTRHGPVIHETDNHFFAVRAGWLEPGMAPYFGSVEYMRASNWREFLGALNRWGAPSENQVYADVDGNIGYKPAGLFPRRGNWDGLMPVPGDGRYEWDGFFDMDVLPVEYNPERGFTGTANSMNLPADYPIEKYPMALDFCRMTTNSPSTTRLTCSATTRRCGPLRSSPAFPHRSTIAKRICCATGTGCYRRNRRRLHSTRSGSNGT